MGYGLCLQWIFAILWNFHLQHYGFLTCNFRYFYLTTNTLGIFSSNENRKANTAVNEFFNALQVGDLDKANGLLDKTGEMNIDFQFDSSDKERLAKAYYSKTEYKVASTSINKWLFKIKEKQVAGELKTPNIVPVMRSALNEVTRLGLSGGLFFGFQNAIAHSSDTFIRNMQNATEMDTTTMVITVIRSDGKYILIPDEMLQERLVSQPEKVFSVLDTLQHKY